jgi:hypothetical protein
MARDRVVVAPVLGRTRGVAKSHDAVGDGGYYTNACPVSADTCCGIGRAEMEDRIDKIFRINGITPNGSPTRPGVIL